MSDYFWSARFIAGTLTLVLGVALLTGALLYLPYAAGEAHYELFLGAACCAVGPVLTLRARAGLAAYAGIVGVALIWSLLQVGLDLWALLPRMMMPLLWGGVLLTLRHRIAPARDPSESPAARLRRARLPAHPFMRGHS